MHTRVWHHIIHTQSIVNGITIAYWLLTFSARGLEKPMCVRVSRGDRFCRWILVGVGFFLGGSSAAILQLSNGFVFCWVNGLGLELTFWGLGLCPMSGSHMPLTVSLYAPECLYSWSLILCLQGSRRAERVTREWSRPRPGERERERANTGHLPS